DRGAIPPADEKTIKMWTNMVIADEATACAQMAKLPGLRNSRLTTATAGNSTAVSTAGLEPEEQFMAKARAFGKEKGCKTEAESITAFASTAEGRELYGHFRETYNKVGAKASRNRTESNPKSKIRNPNQKQK